MKMKRKTSKKQSGIERAVRKFERGGNIGIRGRVELAKEAGCSGHDLLAFLKRRQLYVGFFRPSNSVIENISFCVSIEKQRQLQP